MSQRQYPVKPLNEDSDPRFTLGFLTDVADVLVKHGYPRIAGDDWARFHVMLFRFVYRDSD